MDRLAGRDILISSKKLSYTNVVINSRFCSHSQGGMFGVLDDSLSPLCNKSEMVHSFNICIENKTLPFIPFSLSLSR